MAKKRGCLDEMTELRTLKDFEVLFCNDCDNDVAISVKELRQEAIKWLKAMYESLEIEPTMTIQDTVNKIGLMKFNGAKAVIDTFVKFFNITEEELKDGI